MWPTNSTRLMRNSPQGLGSDYTDKLTQVNRFDSSV